MKTIYIHRPTEDLSEDMNRVTHEVDFFLDGTAGAELCGLMQLANLADVLSS